MVLIGEVGMGKTLLLNKLLDMLVEQDILSAYIFNPAMTATDLLSMFRLISALNAMLAQRASSLCNLITCSSSV